MASASTSQIVAKLNLKPHPEGGFFTETFRDFSIKLSKSHLPSQYKVDRPVSTSIYFLLPSGSVSHLHRIPCAETWHFYMGDPLTVFELDEKDGSVKLTRLGPNPLAENEHLQYTVKPNVWFGAFPTHDIEASSEGGPAVKAAPRDAERQFSLVFELDEKDGSVKLTRLGPNPLAENEHLQYTVKPNVWFGAFPTHDIEASTEGRPAVKAAPRDAERQFTLVGCTCAPAFQFEDFEMAKCSVLISLFPKHESLINLLTFAE